ncbi:DUF5615 family PIN-like protein [Geodermatophilus marinus]|uniref:DUF5615 family PIN-like protein n=1 Tax=Geodermatophilus sp. LHW52908 TaxID=2303986 RepID=UPI000E3BACB0|nr:DUF5615 family PIN-like protein [Geodermatophilus sp. LHW52908]RFU21151.1 hypothetical protein D0Z06_12195 [Geodermatophilus sp. LHW52908]
MRLLLDEMYPRRLAEQLRAQGHDVVAVVEIPELVGSSDLQVARRGQQDGRVVVTENVADYARLGPDEHAGLVLVNARRWPRTTGGLPRLVQALGALLAARNASAETEREIAGAVEWL